jgi:hypothetical protein
VIVRDAMQYNTCFAICKNYIIMHTCTHFRFFHFSNRLFRSLSDIMYCIVHVHVYKALTLDSFGHSA